MRSKSVSLSDRRDLSSLHTDRHHLIPQTTLKVPNLAKKQDFMNTRTPTPENPSPMESTPPQMKAVPLPTASFFCPGLSQGLSEACSLPGNAGFPVTVNVGGLNPSTTTNPGQQVSRSAPTLDNQPDLKSAKPNYHKKVLFPSLLALLQPPIPALPPSPENPPIRPLLPLPLQAYESSKKLNSNNKSPDTELVTPSEVTCQSSKNPDDQPYPCLKLISPNSKGETPLIDLRPNAVTQWVEDVDVPLSSNSSIETLPVDDAKCQESNSSSDAIPCLKLVSPFSKKESPDIDIRPNAVTEWVEDIPAGTVLSEESLKTNLDVTPAAVSKDETTNKLATPPASGKEETSSQELIRPLSSKEEAKTEELTSPVLAKEETTGQETAPIAMTKEETTSQVSTPLVSPKEDTATQEITSSESFAGETTKQESKDVGNSYSSSKLVSTDSKTETPEIELKPSAHVTEVADVPTAINSSVESNAEICESSKGADYPCLKLVTPNSKNEPPLIDMRPNAVTHWVEDIDVPATPSAPPPQVAPVAKEKTDLLEPVTKPEATCQLVNGVEHSYPCLKLVPSNPKNEQQEIDFTANDITQWVDDSVIPSLFNGTSVLKATPSQSEKQGLLPMCSESMDKNLPCRKETSSISSSDANSYKSPLPADTASSHGQESKPESYIKEVSSPEIDMNPGAITHWVEDVDYNELTKGADGRADESHVPSNTLSTKSTKCLPTLDSKSELCKAELHRVPITNEQEVDNMKAGITHMVQNLDFASNAVSNKKLAMHQPVDLSYKSPMNQSIDKFPIHHYSFNIDKKNNFALPKVITKKQ